MKKCHKLKQTAASDYLIKTFWLKSFSSAYPIWRNFQGVLTSFPYCWWWWCTKLEINFLISIRSSWSMIEFSFSPPPPPNNSTKHERKEINSNRFVVLKQHERKKKFLLLAMKIVQLIFFEKKASTFSNIHLHESQFTKMNVKLFLNSIKCNWTRSIHECM